MDKSFTELLELLHEILPEGNTLLTNHYVTKKILCPMGMEYRNIHAFISLLYLTASRPDIIFNFCLCIRFQADPREVYISVIKRIFRHLKRTANLGLWYKRRENFKLQEYSDADYVGDKVEKKITSRGCHFIGGNLISWTSKKQGTIVLSTAEVRYISIAQCSYKLIWIRNQLADYGIHETNIPLFL